MNMLRLLQVNNFPVIWIFYNEYLIRDFFTMAKNAKLKTREI